MFLRVAYEDHLDHLLVCLHLMKGPHDDKLEQLGHWPLRGTFIIELLNQLNDSDHYSRMLQFPLYISSNCTNRVLEGSCMAYMMDVCESQFISHMMLFFHNSTDISYYKDDCLSFFRISLMKIR